MSRKPWRAYGRYGSVGLELILSIGLGYYLGKWADDHFHTRGWLSGAGFLLGCYTGFKALWTVAKRMQKDAEREEKMERGEDPWDEDRLDDGASTPPKDDGYHIPEDHSDDTSDDHADDEQAKK